MVLRERLTPVYFNVSEVSSPDQKMTMTKAIAWSFILQTWLSVILLLCTTGSCLALHEFTVIPISSMDGYEIRAIIEVKSS